MTDASAAVLARESFGAWGARRAANWQGSPSSAEWQSIANTTRRGYTGHEHLDNVLLVHMNGRVYDPAIGRFMSADPYVDGAETTQGWNRYGYVGNRPMVLTDPSGHFSRGDSMSGWVAKIEPTPTSEITLEPVDGVWLEHIIFSFSSSIAQYIGIRDFTLNTGGNGGGGNGVGSGSGKGSGSENKDKMCESSQDGDVEINLAVAGAAAAVAQSAADQGAGNAPKGADAVSDASKSVRTTNAGKLAPMAATDSAGFLRVMKMAGVVGNLYSGYQIYSAFRDNQIQTGIYRTVDFVVGVGIGYSAVANPLAAAAGLIAYAEAGGSEGIVDKMTGGCP